MHQTNSSSIRNHGPCSRLRLRLCPHAPTNRKPTRRNSSTPSPVSTQRSQPSCSPEHCSPRAVSVLLPMCEPLTWNGTRSTTSATPTPSPNLQPVSDWILSSPPVITWCSYFTNFPAVVSSTSPPLFKCSPLTSPTKRSPPTPLFGFWPRNTTPHTFRRRCKISSD